MFRITVMGLDRVIKQSEQYAKEEPHEESFKKCMHEAKTLAKYLCPFDTGMLSSSIYIRKTATLKYDFGFTVHYGVYWEFGTYALKVGSVENPNKIHSGYSPFMRPAMWRTIRKYPEYYKKAVRLH